MGKALYKKGGIFTLIGKNPYAEIIKMMRTHGEKNNPPSIQLGEVISPPADIIIKLGDIEITKENILIADFLLEGYTRTFEATGSIQIQKNDDGKITLTDSDCGRTSIDNVGFVGDGKLITDPHFHSVSSISIETDDFTIESDNFNAEGDDKNNGKCFKFTDTLKKGDIVAVMPTYDMQMYIILARVVRPDE